MTVRTPSFVCIDHLSYHLLAPIHGAVLNGHENIVEYLLSEGADWKTPNNAGKVKILLCVKMSLRTVETCRLCKKETYEETL